VAPFDVQVRQDGDELVVVPVGELDIATVERVAFALEERSAGSGVCLDLTQLDFLDTSGIQLLVETFRNARTQNFALRILRASPRVHRVFEIAGLDSVLPFEDA
jgi:anti-sigma B factor antagonist